MDTLRIPSPPRMEKNPRGVEVPVLTFIEAVELIESTVPGRLQAADAILQVAENVRFGLIRVLITGITAILFHEFEHDAGVCRFAIEVLPTKEKP